MSEGTPQQWAEFIEAIDHWLDGYPSSSDPDEQPDRDGGEDEHHQHQPQHDPGEP